MSIDVPESPLTTLSPLILLDRDLREAAATLGRSEASYLTDTYYQIQEYRKRADNQVRAMVGSTELHATLAFFASQFDTLERQIRGALDVYSANEPMGYWCRQHHGVGPVIAAGLVANIHSERHTSVGQVWRHAGLDPTSEWGKGQKRPYNALLKALCWKLGDSFVKFSGNERCFYGKLYRQRKAYEVKRDEAGGNAETAKRDLKERSWRDAATKKIYESGHLPPGRLDLRARRWAVKIFLSHYFEEAYMQLHGERPAAVYALAHLEHVDYIASPVPSIALEGGDLPWAEGAGPR